MSNIIEGQGLEHLFIKPTGCGEQTMSKLAPLVHLFNYLRSTKQVTKEIEESAFGHMLFGKSIPLLSEIIQLTFDFVRFGKFVAKLRCLL